MWIIFEYKGFKKKVYMGEEGVFYVWYYLDKWIIFGVYYL